MLWRMCIFFEHLSNANEHANQLACPERSGLNSEVPSFELHWLQKVLSFYVIIWEDDRTSHLTY